MPWAGGVFSLLPVSHAEPGTTIRAEQQNAPHEDFTAGLNNCLTRDGSTTMLANLPMNGNKIVGLATATNPGDAVRLDQVPASSAWLQSVSALALTADQFPYATGASTAAAADLTAFARTLLAGADAAAMRTTLGLGDMATKDDVAIADIDATGTADATTRLAGDGTWKRELVRSAAQATTSGTAFDFTGIPADVEEIDLVLSGVSVSGTDFMYALLLDENGDPISDTYRTRLSTLSTSTIAGGASSTAFSLGGNLAVRALYGTLHMRRVAGGNTWLADGHFWADGSTSFLMVAWVPSSVPVRGVRLARSGTDTFDAGSAYVEYR